MNDKDYYAILGVARSVEEKFNEINEAQMVLLDAKKRKLYDQVRPEVVGSIADAQRGDVQAFNMLVLHYQDTVYGYALWMMSDPASADNAAQKTFISAYKAIRRFKQGNFKGWLLRIVNNKCLDLIRKQKRHPEPSIDAITAEIESPPFLEDDAQTPEDQIVESETMTAIQHCIDSLPEGQRAAVILCDVEGYAYNEIANILDVSLGTVKSRLNRARHKLQGSLMGFGVFYLRNIVSGVKANGASLLPIVS